MKIYFKISPAKWRASWLDINVFKFYSSNGNIFRVTGHLCAQRLVTRSFDVFFNLCLNKRMSKQSWGWWFETPSCPLRRHSNENKEIALPAWQFLCMAKLLYTWCSWGCNVMLKSNDNWCDYKLHLCKKNRIIICRLKYFQNGRFLDYMTTQIDSERYTNMYWLSLNSSSPKIWISHFKWGQ